MRNNREHKTINIFWLKLWPSSEKTSHTWHTLGAHKTFAEWLTHNNQLCENASKFFRDILGSNPKASSFPSSCCNSLEWYLLQALLEYAFISHQCCLAPITGRVHEITHPVIICRFSLFLSFSTQVTSQKKKKEKLPTKKANLKSTFKKTIWKSIKIIYVHVGKFTFLYSRNWHSSVKQLYSN